MKKIKNNISYIWIIILLLVIGTMVACVFFSLNEIEKNRQVKVNNKLIEEQTHIETVEKKIPVFTKVTEEKVKVVEKQVPFEVIKEVEKPIYVDKYIDREIVKEVEKPVYIANLYGKRNQECEHQKIIDDLKATIEHKDTLINDLENEITEQRKRIENNNKTIQELKDMRTLQRETIKNKNFIIDDLEKRLAILTREETLKKIDNFIVVINDLDAEISKLTGKPLKGINEYIKYIF